MTSEAVVFRMVMSVSPISPVFLLLLLFLIFFLASIMTVFLSVLTSRSVSFFFLLLLTF